MERELPARVLAVVTVNRTCFSTSGRWPVVRISVRSAVLPLSCAFFVALFHGAIVAQ